MVLTRDFNRSRKKLYLTVLSFGIPQIKIRGRDWSARSLDLNPFSIYGSFLSNLSYLS